MDSDLQLLCQIVEKEKRFSLDAYLFVREALAFAADSLELECCADQVCDLHAEYAMERGDGETGDGKQRHVTGQQLCEGIRQYALSQFGYMSKTVLNNWGVRSTSDIGSIVYKMINAGIMKKSSKDRRAHFDDVFDFDEAFEQNFDFAPTCCRHVPTKAKDVL
jgi:uncharacterized repeat protein (TIGR04138 family)